MKSGVRIRFFRFFPSAMSDVGEVEIKLDYVAAAAPATELTAASAALSLDTQGTHETSGLLALSSPKSRRITPAPRVTSAREMKMVKEEEISKAKSNVGEFYSRQNAFVEALLELDKAAEAGEKKEVRDKFFQTSEHSSRLRVSLFFKSMAYLYSAFPHCFRRARRRARATRRARTPPKLVWPFAWPSWPTSSW